MTHKLSNDILHLFIPNRVKAKKSFNLSDNNFKFPDNIYLYYQTNNISYKIGEILLYQHTFM